jgi:hypothetical protein
MVFSALTPGDHPFRSLAGFVQEDDALHFAGTSTTLWIDRAVTNVRFELGFDIRAVVGTGQHQIASGVDAGVDPFYFVELNESVGGTTRDCAVVSYDAVNGYTSLDSAMHLGMHPGRGVFRYDASVTGGQQGIFAGWIGEMYQASAATPTYAGAPATRIVFNGLDIALLYFVVIVTP